MAKKAKTEEPAAQPKGRKPKQGYLPEMEPPHIDEIDRAADAYVEARDARMRLGESEVERRDILHALMKKNKLTNYKYDGKTVALVADEKVKVKRNKDAEENSDGDD